jgi:putative ABC transport system substrate-binding protein
MNATRIAPTVALLATVALVATACSGTPSSDADGSLSGKSVCIDQYASAAVIEDILTGVREGLADAEEEGLTIDVQNPQGDAATEQTIAQKFVTDDCTVIGAVGTSGAQAHMNTGADIPLVFMAASTPIEAGLVASFEQPGGRATGAADVFDVERDIDAMLEIDPDVRAVGLVWRVGDPSGDPLAEQATAYLDERGIEAIPATITTGADITQAAQSLAGKVDAIMIPGDTTTISAAAGLIAVADEAGIPVFGGSSSVVSEGGIVSVGYDYVDLGREAARLIVEILDGGDPAEIPVAVPAFAGYDVNETKAAELGLTIPADLQILNTY